MRKTEQNKLTKTRAHRTYNTRYTGENGITLVSLVITIIVLLILAGVGINMAINSDGLFAKANEATGEWNISVGQEETTINNWLETLEEMTLIPEPMITKWNIAEGDTVRIDLYNTEYVDNTDLTIDWGDGIVEHYTNSNLQYEYWGYGYITHTYTTANSNNIVTINGKCNTIDMVYLPQLTSIEQWGYTETYKYSFEGCENLGTIASPEKYTFKNVRNFYSTFMSCSSLINIPEELFANCVKVTSFNHAFSSCSSLTNIPEELFVNCRGVINFNYIFYGCSSLTTIPEELFANCTSVRSFENAFEECTDLVSIPDNMFANCTYVTSFTSAFRGCTNLQTIPEHLFENTPNVTSFVETFAGCTSLTGNPIPLWERVEDGASNNYKGVPDGNGCYHGCTGLTGYNDGTIPDYWGKGIPE